MAIDASYLETLVSTLAAELDVLRAAVVAEDKANVEDAARSVCLASRSAYSEFRALVIDRNPALTKIRPELFKLHQNALRALTSVEAVSPFVGEFKSAIEDRMNELQDSHIFEHVAAQ